MRIGIDCRLIGEAGIGRYISNLLSNLQKLDLQNNYYIFLGKKDFDSLTLPKNFHKVLADFGWYSFSEQLYMPVLLYKYKLDLVHFPHFNVPIFYKGKFVVTIHDLIHQHFSLQRATTHGPITYKIKQFGYKKVFKIAVNGSKKILTPSNFIKNQLEKEWQISGERIVVTPEAIDDRIISIVNKMNLQQSSKVLKKFNIKPPYVFYIGNAHPHKNIEGLIKSFLNLKEKYPNLSLVLSGKNNYFWQKIKDKFLNKNIIYIGFINDAELVVLYKNAEVFVMPSFEEGFGIPVLEAMACGTPVVSSNAGSLPEVGGDAALYFDPKKINDMTDKILQVLKNHDLRKFLIENGKNRIKQFSWKKLAKQTLEVYLTCV